MVQDSGAVPLCAKGVVVGLNNTSIDVLWDVPFVSGTDLGGRFVTSTIIKKQFTELLAGALNIADLHARSIPALT